MRPFPKRTAHPRREANRRFAVLIAHAVRHGQRLAFDQDNNTPLCRLYVSMLQRMGIEADQFASGKGTLPGVEMA